MNKIYIVTSGQYSDYGIDAVFSEKSLAKKYIDSFKKDDYGDRMEIEEWDLDKNSDQLKAGRKPFHVQIKKMEKSLKSVIVIQISDLILYSIHMEKIMILLIFIAMRIMNCML
jgi:hypothetical protein